MSRKAKHTDRELDERIADFFGNAGRKPTYSEIKEMCPLGVSNDRISSALSRAEECGYVCGKADGADTRYVPTAPPGVFRKVMDEFFREFEAQQAMIQTLQAENSNLRASQKRILARHSADIAKAVKEVREEAEAQLKAMARAFVKLSLED
jgi:galactokinase/mevalonate kinase-like predicted kinase